MCQWSQILKPGKQTKKLTEQLVATNVAINDLNERKKRAKNVIIYGASESTKRQINRRQT